MMSAEMVVSNRKMNEYVHEIDCHIKRMLEEGDNIIIHRHCEPFQEMYCVDREFNKIKGLLMAGEIFGYIKPSDNYHIRTCLDGYRHRIYGEKYDQRNGAK